MSIVPPTEGRENGPTPHFANEQVTAEYGLTDADRADLHTRLVSWFGDDRQAFLVSHLAPVVDRIKAEAAARAAAESQWNAVEMARKADQAERRAEGAEDAFERLRSAADKVGHQAVCPVTPCNCWMRDLVAALEEREELRADCACWPPYDSCSHPSHPPCVCDGCIGAKCDHQWLDRPESDTRECLICGTEVAG